MHARVYACISVCVLCVHVCVFVPCNGPLDQSVPHSVHVCTLLLLLLLQLPAPLRLNRALWCTLVEQNGTWTTSCTIVLTLYSYMFLQTILVIIIALVIVCIYICTILMCLNTIWAVAPRETCAHLFLCHLSSPCPACS